MSPRGKKRLAEAALVLPSVLVRPEDGVNSNGSNNSQRVEKRLERLEVAVKNLVDLDGSLEGAMKNLVDYVGEGAKPTQKYPECPVCLEDMIQDTRIMMCPAGHVICGGCHDKMEDKICPSCMMLIKIAGLFSLEQSFRQHYPEFSSSKIFRDWRQPSGRTRSREILPLPLM